MSVGRSLVLGGTGAIGRALRRSLGPAKVVATGTPARGAWDGVGPLVAFDATRDDPGALIDAHGPFDGVFLMFGMTAPDACARDPEGSHLLNVTAMIRAIQACEARELPVVFTSSEVVFDGARGGYTEDDPPSSLLLYGRQKLEVEARLARYRGRAVIARVARVIGAGADDGGLIADMVASLRGGRTSRVAADQRFCPILADDVASALIVLSNRKESGVFHIAGPEAVSRFEIARRCRRLLIDRGEDVRGSVEAGSLTDFPTLEPRPRDVSLRIDRLIAATGAAPRGVDAMLSAAITALSR